MNAQQAASSLGFSGYSLATLGVKDSLKSIRGQSLVMGEGGRRFVQKTHQRSLSTAGKCYLVLVGGDSKFHREGSLADVFVESHGFLFPIYVRIVLC